MVVTVHEGDEPVVERCGVGPVVDLLLDQLVVPVSAHETDLDKQQQRVTIEFPLDGYRVTESVTVSSSVPCVSGLA